MSKAAAAERRRELAMKESAREKRCKDRAMKLTLTLTLTLTLIGGVRTGP